VGNKTAIKDEQVTTTTVNELTWAKNISTKQMICFLVV
jgi:hypothetical protein